MKMLIICLLFSVGIYAADDPEPTRTIITTKKEMILLPTPSTDRHMEVIDKTESGTLVRLFQVERKLVGFEMRDVRRNDELVIVLGLGNGVGTLVEESRLYETGDHATFKGTLYKVYRTHPPDDKFKEVDQGVVSPNPAWLRWQEANKAKQAKVQSARIAAYQLRQAEKGYPSFQLEIAKRYLNGDGVEVNTNLAVHWLEAACTNHESQASNILKSIDRQFAQ